MERSIRSMLISKDSERAINTITKKLGNIFMFQPRYRGDLQSCVPLDKLKYKCSYTMSIKHNGPTCAKNSCSGCLLESNFLIAEAAPHLRTP